MRPTIVLYVEGAARTLRPPTVVDWQAEMHRAATMIAASWGARPRRAPDSTSSGGSPAGGATSGRCARANTVGLLVDEPGDARSGDQAQVDIADGHVPGRRAPYSSDRTAPDRSRYAGRPGRGRERENEVRTMGLPTPFARVLDAVQGAAPPQVHQAPAVRWLSVPQLVRTALDVLQASSFAKYADKRETMATTPREFYRLPAAGEEPRDAVFVD